MSHRRITSRRMALLPTTALRDPANYGLRGLISMRSNDLPAILSGLERWVCSEGRLSGRIVRHCGRPVGVLGELSREFERHEDVEGPDRPAVAWVCGSRHGVCGLRDGVGRNGAAG